MEIQLFGPEPCLRHKIVVLRFRWEEGMPSPPQRDKTRGARNANLVSAVLRNCVVGIGGACHDAKPLFCVVNGAQSREDHEGLAH